MGNNNLIQILRGGDNYDPKTSTHVLNDGQPFYSKKNKKLYIGDLDNAGEAKPLKDLKGTEIGLPIESGSGENSIQLPLEGEDFTYIGSDKILHTYSNETTGNYSTNLSPQGKVEREYSLNVGYQNALEFKEDEASGFTDGGAIIGYRNYSNSTNSFLTGAWNRSINTSEAFIAGYDNAIFSNMDTDGDDNSNGFDDRGSAIFGARNSLNGNIRKSLLAGEGLLNRGTNGGHEYHFGYWNDPRPKDTNGNYIDNLILTLGNGKEDIRINTGGKKTIINSDNTLNITQYNSCLAANKSYIYRPTKEGCWLISNATLSTQLKETSGGGYNGIFVMSDGVFYENDGTEIVDFSNYTYDANKQLFYKSPSVLTYDATEGDNVTKVIEIIPGTTYFMQIVASGGSRSNAFQVTTDGRAQLIRKNNSILGDNDLLTKKEIENYVTEKTNLNIENGTGENSLQLPQSAGTFTYKSSNIEYTYETATTGKDALNLSSLGRVTRNGYAVVGNYNAVEYDANNKLDADDGGIIAGYKNYTNTRGSSIFGAHNRILDTKNSFILGYQNTIDGAVGDGSSCALIVGGSNYMHHQTRHSSMIGYGLKNSTNHPFQYHFGTWNDTRDDKVRFTIGNGIENWIYQDVQLGTPDTRPKPTLQECITVNESLKYNGRKEGWRYIKVDNAYQLITSATSQTDFDNSLVYQYINAGRSNAFQVTSDGRAQLFQKEVDGAFIEKGDNDILVKAEVQSEIDAKFATLDNTLIWEKPNFWNINLLSPGWYRFFIESISVHNNTTNQDDAELFYDKSVHVDIYIDNYTDRNTGSIRNGIGGYKPITWTTESRGYIPIAPNWISFDTDGPNFGQWIHYPSTETSPEMEETVSYYTRKVEKLNRV